MKLQSINPYSSSVVYECEELSDKQINTALENSEKAFASWKKSSFDMRSRFMNKASDTLLREKKELARIITEEMGKPIKESQSEIEKICGIQEKWTKISEALGDALDNLSSGYELKDLLTELDNQGTHGKKAKTYVRRLQYLKVFGTSTTDIDKFLKPQSISVIDLSGLDDSVSVICCNDTLGY